MAATYTWHNWSFAGNPTVADGIISNFQTAFVRAPQSMQRIVLRVANMSYRASSVYGQKAAPVAVMHRVEIVRTSQGITETIFGQTAPASLSTYLGPPAADGNGAITLIWKSDLIILDGDFRRAAPPPPALDDTYNLYVYYLPAPISQAQTLTYPTTWRFDVDAKWLTSEPGI